MESIHCGILWRYSKNVGVASSMEITVTKLASGRNEVANLCRVLEKSKQEDNQMKLLQQLELKVSLSGMEIMQALKTFILTCSSIHALKNLMQLFIQKVSMLISHLGLLEDEQKAEEALIIVNHFWSVCANKNAAFMKKQICRFSAELYEVLPSLASIYVDLFISANKSKKKIKKLSRKLYGRLNFELNERCIKTALLEVSQCSQLAAQILSPVLIKLLSEAPAKNSESHLDYLLHFILLKRWLPVCGDLKNIAERSLRIKAPVEFGQWLVQRWPQGSDYIPQDKSFKGRRVSQLLLELDGKATEELIDLFAECLVSGELNTGASVNTESPKPVFVIDKKGMETNKLMSPGKRPKKKRTEHKPQEMDLGVADNSELLLPPEHLLDDDKKDDNNKEDHDDATGDDEEEAMELDDSDEVDVNRFDNKKTGRKEKTAGDSDTCNKNVRKEADQKKCAEISAEALGFFIDRNSKSPKKQQVALKHDSALDYFHQQSDDNSLSHDVMEKSVKNPEREIQIIDLTGISGEKDSVHGESDQDLIILESSEINSTDFRSGKMLSVKQKTGKNPLSPSKPSPKRAKQLAETPILCDGSQQSVSKSLATDADLISNRDAISEIKVLSPSQSTQSTPTLAMSRSPQKSLKRGAETIAASDSDESENGSLLTVVKRKKMNKSLPSNRSSSLSPEIEIIDVNKEKNGKTHLDDRKSNSSSSEVVDLTHDNPSIEYDLSASENDVDEQAGLENDDDEQVGSENDVEEHPVVGTEGNSTVEDPDSLSLANTEAGEVSKSGTSEREIGLALAQIRRSMNVADKNLKRTCTKPSDKRSKIRTKSEGCTKPSQNRRLKGGSIERTAVKSKPAKSTVLMDWLRRPASQVTSTVMLHKLEDLKPEHKNDQKVESEGVTPLSHTRKPPRSLSQCDNLMDKKPQEETLSSPEKKPRSSPSKSPCKLNSRDEPVSSMPNDQTESLTRKIRKESESSPSHVKEALMNKPSSSAKKNSTSLPLTLSDSKISREINATEHVVNTSLTSEKTPSPVKTPFTKLSQKITNKNTEAQSPLPLIDSVSPQKQGKNKNPETAKELTPSDVFGKSLRTYSRKDPASLKKKLPVTKPESKVEIKLKKLPTGLTDSTSPDSSPQKGQSSPQNDQSSPLKRTYFLRGSSTKRLECQACGLKQDCTKHQQTMTDSDTGSAKANKSEITATSQKTPKKSPVNRRKSLRSSLNPL